MARTRHFSPAHDLRRRIETAERRIREIDMLILRQRMGENRLKRLAAGVAAGQISAARAEQIKARSMGNREERIIALEKEKIEQQEDITSYTKQLMGMLI